MKPVQKRTFLPKPYAPTGQTLGRTAPAQRRTSTTRPNVVLLEVMSPHIPAQRAESTLAMNAVSMFSTTLLDETPERSGTHPHPA
jgi:hypothetical protein